MMIIKWGVMPGLFFIQDHAWNLLSVVVDAAAGMENSWDDFENPPGDIKGVDSAPVVAPRSPLATITNVVRRELQTSGRKLSKRKSANVSTNLSGKRKPAAPSLPPPPIAAQRRSLPGNQDHGQQDSLECNAC